jgi:TetR/AcrR family transcriptional repressor of nem operon
MARGTTNKAAKTRDAILRVAESLFHSHGYNATGIDEVIKGAAVTKGGFYYYFASKEELVLAVIARRREETLADYGLAEPDPSKTPMRRLRHLFDRIEADLTRPVEGGGMGGSFFGGLAAELSAGSEPVRSALADYFETLSARTAGVIEKGIRAGGVATGIDPARFAVETVVRLEGAALMAKVANDPSPVVAAVADLVAALTGEATAASKPASTQQSLF